METYLTQLLDDIAYATENVNWPFIRKESYDIWEVPMPEDEERNAPQRDLETWTGLCTLDRELDDHVHFARGLSCGGPEPTIFPESSVVNRE